MPWFALECFMDISTGLGLAFGGIVLVTLIMMGGDLKMFLDVHAFIVRTPMPDYVAHVVDGRKGHVGRYRRRRRVRKTCNAAHE